MADDPRFARTQFARNIPAQKELFNRTRTAREVEQQEPPPPVIDIQSAFMRSRAPEATYASENIVPSVSPVMSFDDLLASQAGRSDNESPLPSGDDVQQRLSNSFSRSGPIPNSPPVLQKEGAIAAPEPEPKGDGRSLVDPKQVVPASNTLSAVNPNISRDYDPASGVTSFTGDSTTPPGQSYDVFSRDGNLSVIGGPSIAETSAFANRMAKMALEAKLANAGPGGQAAAATSIQNGMNLEAAVSSARYKAQIDSYEATMKSKDERKIAAAERGATMIEDAADAISKNSGREVPPAILLSQLMQSVDGINTAISKGNKDNGQTNKLVGKTEDGEDRPLTNTELAFVINAFSKFSAADRREKGSSLFSFSNNAMFANDATWDSAVNYALKEYQ